MTDHLVAAHSVPPHLFSIFIGFTSVGVLLLIIAIVWIRSILKRWRLKAKAAGYPSLSTYLRAAPQTDLERKEAVDLAMKGLVMFLIGLFFPPLLIISAFPLFFGLRKIAYWSVGVGILDEYEQPGT